MRLKTHRIHIPHSTRDVVAVIDSVGSSASRQLGTATEPGLMVPAMAKRQNYRSDDETGGDEIEEHSECKLWLKEHRMGDRIQRGPSFLCIAYADCAVKLVW